MYLDILGTDANIQVNVKLANIVGLLPAVYFAELTNALYKLKQANSVQPDGYFTVDRTAVTARTTIPEQEQFECDSILGKLSLLAVKEDNPNVVALDLVHALETIISDIDAKATVAVKKKLTVNKSEVAAKKKAGQIIGMKKVVAEMEPCVEVQEALCSWVDAVYASKVRGFLKRDIVENFINKIHAISSDPAVLTAIIFIAAENGWSDPDWAINSYNRQKRQNVNATMTTVTQRRATALDTENKF